MKLTYQQQMLWREPAARPARRRRELYFKEVTQRMMKLAAGSGALENMAPASDVHSASYWQRTFGKHQGTALANLLQVARNRFRYTPAGDIDYGD